MNCLPKTAWPPTSLPTVNFPPENKTPSHNNTVVEGNKHTW
ncbi:hypothetical protein B33_36610 [Bacillus safensis]|nr:hypothetical protein B33_36610 [Bacillus safensis]